MYTPKITKPPILTVGQLTHYIKNILEGDPRLMTVLVSGEISGMLGGFKRGKHHYFVLKDKEAVINATLFAGMSQTLRFEPENGMKVLCRGKIEVYPPQGKYQIIIEDMQPDGLGALNLAYEQLKKSLSDEGLFDEAHKKPIPRFPETIGVITSPTGAAVQDILNILTRRFPCVDIILYPSQVQGDAAPAQLTKAVQELDASGECDTIIIGRGGGSTEDLWAFNDEQLARAIYAAHTPVISAVGHETDFTICDFVSDTRAPTPSAAAELAVPDKTELMNYYNALHRNINAVVKTIYTENSKFIKDLERMIVALSPEKELNRYDGEIRLLEARLDSAMSEKLTGAEHSLRSYAAKLEGLNPMSVLARGYSVAEKDGEVLTKVAQLQTGDRFTLTLSDGSVTAQVTGD